MSKKKVMALLLAVTMVMGSSITVFAAEGDNTGSTQGAGTSEGHVDKEVLNVILPTIASGTTPFAYTMDPERLIQGTDASKYAEGTVFPDAATDTGVYFLVGENQYANTSNTLQAINRSSCDVTFTVKVKTTQNTAKDIALADSDTPATDSAELYLGLKVGQTSQVVSATEATVTKTVAGTPANFEIAVDESKAYVYREKESATTWKAIDISMTGAVSKFAIAADTTAPTVEVTWSYAKAAEGATVDTADQVEYNVTPPTPTVALSGTYSRANNAIKFTLTNIGDRTVTGIKGYNNGTAINGQFTSDHWSVNEAKTELTIDGTTAPFGAGAVGGTREIGVILSDSTEIKVSFTVEE